MQTRNCFGLIFCALLLSSCQSFPDDGRRLYLPNGSLWQLLSPADAGLSVAYTQKISARFDGQTMTLLMQLEIDPSVTSLAAINPAMASLFSLQDDGRHIVTQISPLAPKQLDPRYVLADIQLVYWPLEKLQPSLRGAGLDLSDMVENHARHRILTNAAGEELVHIVYQDINGSESIAFNGVARHYSYRIETLSGGIQ